MNISDFNSMFETKHKINNKIEKQIKKSNPLMESLTKTKRLQERKWQLIIPGSYRKAVMDAGEEEDFELVRTSLMDICDFVISKSDDEDIQEEYQDLKEELEYVDIEDVEEADYWLNELYDLMDNTDVFLGIDESLNESAYEDRSPEDYAGGYTEWELVDSKDVQDFDDFWTSYNLWYNPITDVWGCTFGDPEIYYPENTDFDNLDDFENEDEAREWFDNYDSEGLRINDAYYNESFDDLNSDVPGGQYYQPGLEDANNNLDDSIDNYDGEEIPFNEAYGGAYDIEDDMFFTKEDIESFAYDIVDEFASMTNQNCQLADVFMPNPKRLTIEVECDGDYYNADINIDMRKIRKPNDIYRYKDTVLQQLKDSFDELSLDESCHSKKKKLKEAKIRTGGMEQSDRDIIEPLVNALDDIEKNFKDCYITWNFGRNRDGKMTAGVDVSFYKEQNDEVINTVERIFEEYGYIPDASLGYDKGPRQNVFGHGYHYQIIEQDSLQESTFNPSISGLNASGYAAAINKVNSKRDNNYDINHSRNYDEVKPLINSLDKLEKKCDCSISWNFKKNKAGVMTAGIDVYLEESSADKTLDYVEQLFNKFGYKLDSELGYENGPRRHPSGNGWHYQIIEISDLKESIFNLFNFKFFNEDGTYVTHEISASNEKEAWKKATQFMDDNDYVDCDIANDEVEESLNPVYDFEALIDAFESEFGPDGDFETGWMAHDPSEYSEMVDWCDENGLNIYSHIYDDEDRECDFYACDYYGYIEPIDKPMNESLEEPSVDDYRKLSSEERTKLRDNYVSSVLKKEVEENPDYYKSSGNFMARETGLLKKENAKIRSLNKNESLLNENKSIDYGKKFENKFDVNWKDHAGTPVPKFDKKKINIYEFNYDSEEPLRLNWYDIKSNSNTIKIYWECQEEWYSLAGMKKEFKRWANYWLDNFKKSTGQGTNADECVTFKVTVEDRDGYSRKNFSFSLKV